MAPSSKGQTKSAAVELEIDGELTAFGTTGYTYKNRFLLYARATESVWYPLQKGEFNTLSCKLQGNALPYMAEPEIVLLGESRKLHPRTVVLIER